MADSNARIAQFEKMAHDDSDNDMAHFSLGNAYLQARRAAEAARSFERCIELNPNQPEPFNNRGAVLAQKGDSLAAIVDFARAVHIRPQYAEAHFNLARVNAQLGKCDLASAHLKEAIELQPAYRQVARAVGDFEACHSHPGFTVRI